MCTPFPMPRVPVSPFPPISAFSTLHTTALRRVRGCYGFAAVGKSVPLETYALHYSNAQLTSKHGFE